MTTYNKGEVGGSRQSPNKIEQLPYETMLGVARLTVQGVDRRLICDALGISMPLLIALKKNWRFNQAWEQAERESNES